ncbi:hypothetical protein EN829_021520 [Mesorhizobium sp. M00.F.Ca.ET.186.01.1.1]|nr:hypothetical protein EN848_29570 [bacterium M00.F.Ca.ET.205.01.1.1]TGU50665.1 hypothetical protein EN795_23565 [bacterium M00.F.Ca.ET.152.01.1.1]TGV34141.1 hypothetical protein EN829_021520 [Mesorhizobium sp. M00.F.Ca.ET.186.01.1.1]TGZ41029.1 hypothetical protein EN805_22960 [bacterium M00.F.Ca.ET.162.01.1.1]
MSDQNVLVRAAIGRLLSEKTGATSISMKESIDEVLGRTGFALSDDSLQDLLLEMAEARGMLVVVDI